MMPEQQTAQNLLVRIKPFNRHQGNLTRRYTYRGTKFEVDRGWYLVPEWIACEMKGLRHPSNGNKIFDVATADQAAEIDEEEAAEETARPADMPNVPKSFRGDLPKTKSPEAETVLDPGPAEDLEPIATPVNPAPKQSKVVSRRGAKGRRSTVAVKEDSE